MRSVPEWRGKTDDTDPPAHVKLRICRRQGHKCHVCGRQLDFKNKPEFDHIPALWDGGENREAAIFAVCKSPCHSDHTRADKTVKAKAEKKEKDRVGIKRKRHTFRGWRRVDGSICWNPQYGKPR